ncbi:MAG: hypothetical protein AAF984_01355 [Verrucomicrobiota bacterium]
MSCQVHVQDLKPGSILEKEVRGGNDELLAPAGAELTEKTIEMLGNRGVASVIVEGEEENIRSKFSEQVVAEVETSTTELILESSRDNKLIKAIIDQSIDYKLRKKLEMPAGSQEAAA